MLPAQVTVCESQRYPALALWRHVPAARVQVLQSACPAFSVPGLRREAPHAPQLRPPPLRVRPGTGGGSGTGGQSGSHRAAQQQHHSGQQNGHVHLSTGESVSQSQRRIFTWSEVIERSWGVTILYLIYNYYFLNFILTSQSACLKQVLCIKSS